MFEIELNWYYSVELVLIQLFSSQKQLQYLGLANSREIEAEERIFQLFIFLLSVQGSVRIRLS